MTDYTIAVLEDAILLLDLIKNNHTGLTLAQIAEASGLVKNKVFRILFTLEKDQLVEKDENGRFCLGLRMLEFGHHVQRKTLLLKASNPVMDHLVEKTQESIFLGVISGAEALCIATRESPRSIRLFAEVGIRATLHSGGVPKVLFAYLSEDQREQLLDHYSQIGRDRFGNPIDQQVLNDDLATIRRNGYVVANDDLDADAHSIAAPIRNHAGQVIAAMSIAGPSQRFTDDCIENYIRLILEATHAVSEALGHQSPQPTTDKILDPLIS